MHSHHKNVNFHPQPFVIMTAVQPLMRNAKSFHSPLFNFKF
jgi:hypothetical protein